MRHRVYGKHLGRDKNQRSALFKGLVRSLFLYESITTTETKAKAIKGLVDTLISKGRTGNNQAREFIQSMLPDKEISKKLLTDIAPRYKSRISGFTGLVKLGRRSGDSAMMVKMTLMEGEEKLKSTDQNEELTEKTEDKKKIKRTTKKNPKIEAKKEKKEKSK